MKKSNIKAVCAILIDTRPMRIFFGFEKKLISGFRDQEQGHKVKAKIIIIFFLNDNSLIHLCIVI